MRPYNISWIELSRTKNEALELAATHWKHQGEKLRLPLFFKQITSTLASAQAEQTHAHGTQIPKGAQALLDHLNNGGSLDDVGTISE